ncbi:hypothetical protein N9Y42_06000 [Mariniblastus sp.]|nr:hypothetical protein [Mariniblastus sp.]
MSDAASVPNTVAATISEANESENRSLLKVVIAAILISLLWKLPYYMGLDYFNRTMPLQDPFFPAFFRNQTVARMAYLIAVAVSTLLLLSKSRSILTFGSMLLVGTLFTLNIHQSGFNDVTFLCCGWSALWCLWFSTQISEANQSLLPRAAWLSHAILSLILIGGAVGKMTPEYWSGQVLYEIYFVDRDFWFYNIIRDSCTADGLRDAATLHSRLVIVTEFACGFLWLLPMRIASCLVLAVLMGIALTNNTMLFSVVTSLIGLSIIGLHQSKQPAIKASETA